MGQGAGDCLLGNTQLQVHLLASVHVLERPTLPSRPFTRRRAVNVGKGGDWLLPFLCDKYRVRPEEALIVGDRCAAAAGEGQGCARQVASSCFASRVPLLPQPAQLPARSRLLPAPHTLSHYPHLLCNPQAGHGRCTGPGGRPADGAANDGGDHRG